MKVHLIKSEEVSPEMFTRVYDLLTAVPGAIGFNCDRESIINFDEDGLYLQLMAEREKTDNVLKCKKSGAGHLGRFPLERQAATWDVFFEKTAIYRSSRRIPQGEFVLLLTDVPNQLNWFAVLDEQMPWNGFIHTGDWEHFVRCSPEFPVAYEVVALLLQKHTFNSISEVVINAHKDPIGCVSDMCMEKKEIILKLRTADICPECWKRLSERLPSPVIHHALQLMESLRVKMLYSQNFRQQSVLSRLKVDNRFRVLLPEFGNIEIKLYPLEKALYLLFLRHPEGIYLSALSDHRQELIEIYSRISTRGMMTDMRERINDLTNVLSNSAHEKLSRIKRCFQESIGTSLAEHYIIQGPPGELRHITLDRALVSMEAG